MSSREAIDDKKWQIVRYCRNVYLTIRMSTLGFSLLLPLLGAGSSQHELSGPMILLILTVGLAFHIFSYVLNDVVDLPIDRTEPLRADSLLVRGKISPCQALCLALIQPPLAFVVAWMADVPYSSLLSLGAAFFLLALYDIYGKRCPAPLVMDILQAAGWCALLLFGAFSAAPVLRLDTIWLTVYVFFSVLLINGIHGGVRDLANDFAHRAQTTAIWLGARPGEECESKLPRKLIIYGFALQAAVVGSALMTLHSLEYASGDQWYVKIPVVTGLTMSTLMLLGLLFCLKGRRLLVAFGASHTIISMAIMPALYLPVLGAGTMAAVLAVFLIPAVAMYLYNGTHWCL